MLLEPSASILVFLLIVCKCSMSHSVNFTKSPCAKQAPLHASLLSIPKECLAYFTSTVHAVWRQSAYVTAHCAISCRKTREKTSFQTVLLSEYNISLHIPLSLFFITQDKLIKRNFWVLCRNFGSYSDSIPYI